MAKRKDARQRIVIDHFRGVHQEVNPDDYTYSRAMMGLIDEHGGMLSRIGGKIAFGSNPLSSVWGIHQLRFKDNWGIVVHNGSSRDWYDHNVYKGPGDAFIDPTPDPDPHIEIIPGDILPGDPWPHRPKPAYSHSDIIPHYGIFEYPVDDLRICWRIRASASGPASYATKGLLLAGIDAMWIEFKSGAVTGDWGDWSSELPSYPWIDTPFLRFQVMYYAPSSRWYLYLVAREVQYSVRSDRLAGINPPPAPPSGGAYEKALVSLCGLVTGDLTSFINNTDAGLGVPCGTGSMPLMGTILPTSVEKEDWEDNVESAIAAAFADPGVYHYLYYDEPAWDADTALLTLKTGIGGWFEHVNSHFED